MHVFIIFSISFAFVAQTVYGSSLLFLKEEEEFCKLIALRPKCDPNAKYRPISGVCNNLQNPKWGAEYNVFQRLTKARFKDGIFQIPDSVNGGRLPGARDISVKVFSDRNVTSDVFTVILPQFGQFVAEDGGFTASSNNPKNCCRADGTLAQPLDPMCLYIPVESDDPTQSIMPRQCMDFIRTSTDLTANCSGYVNTGPSKQINAVTSYVDLSGVYGSNDVDGRMLRTLRDGLLKTSIYKGAEYPTFMTKETSICPEDNPTGRCFLGGDFRINENPALSTVYITFLREHNRLARELKKLNPSWQDEKLYQEARRINIAQYQYIVYHHYFAEFLGKWFMKKNQLIFHDRGDERVDDYDPNVNANMVAEHATAAHRFFHTMVQGTLNMISRQNTKVGETHLREYFFRGGVVQTGNFMEEISRGMCRQAASAPDRNLVDDIREYLFNGGATLGADLKAIDIQRDRDHGLGSYNDAREYCGLPRATTWTGFADEISQADIDRLRVIYKHPDDVDLSVGAALERIVADAACGRTFQCIMAKQLYHSRVGDRFFYENNNPGVKFTREQLKEIRKASLARIYCDTGRSITRTQRNVFRLPSDENPIVDCTFIPKLSLLPWKEGCSSEDK